MRWSVCTNTRTQVILVVSKPANGQKAPLKAVFSHHGPEYESFGAFATSTIWSQYCQNPGPVASARVRVSSVVLVVGHCPLENRLGAFWPCLGPSGLKMASAGPEMGPERQTRAKTENWPYIWLDGSNRDSKNTFPTYNPPNLGGFQPLSWPNRAAKGSFCLMRVHSVAFGGVSEMGSKMVQNGGKMTFPKMTLDCLECLWR